MLEYQCDSKNGADSAIMEFAGIASRYFSLRRDNASGSLWPGSDTAPLCGRLPSPYITPTQGQTGSSSLSSAFTQCPFTQKRESESFD
jgi:hypothetical protein